MIDDSLALEAFEGTIRLFPLPNIVLFPHAVQALHIFEPRYRQMTADALDGDRLIAPALLRPGWEHDDDDRPAVHAILCVGRIVADQQLADGRYNLLLRGLSRARIIEEVDDGKAYRSARAELLPEGAPPPASASRPLRDQIAAAALPWFQQHPPALEQLKKLVEGETPLAVLCDLLSFAVPLPVETKQELLAEPEVICRTERLLKALRLLQPASPSTSRRFPPEFSPN